MRSRTVCLIAGLAGVTGVTGLTFGTLLGVLPDFPVVVYDNQGTLTYNISAGGILLPPGSGLDLLATGLLRVTASPIAIRFSPSEPPRFVVPTGDPAIEGLIVRARIDENGLLYGGVINEDLILIGEVDADGDGLIDYAGILLTGEIAEFGFEDVGTATDKYDLRVTVTGGALADAFFLDRDIGVVVTSEGSSFGGLFTTSFSGGAKGILGPINLRGDLGGCTPGYWKQLHHFDSWPLSYGPDDLFEDVFGPNVDVLGEASPTLAEALRLKRGGLNALIRHSTAALLNAASGGVVSDQAFDTPAEVIAAFQAAFASGDFETTKGLLEDSNENGCPLN